MERLNTQWRTERIPPQFHRTVNTLIETLIKPDRLQRDLFFALLLILMKESDFVLQKGNKDDTDILDHIVHLRNRENGSHEADFVLRKFTSTPIKFIATTVSDLILVNAMVPEINCFTQSLCLLKDKYIPLTIFGLPEKFSYMDELCTLFKDYIVTPVKSTILSYYNYSSASLSGLPSKLVYDILIELSIRDIVKISETCKKIYNIVNSDVFWYHLMKRDFYLPQNFDGSWQVLYIKTYISEKNKVLSTVTKNLNSLPTIEVRDYEPRFQVIL
ncbi:uncharacterized protein LOC116772152 [Danaus plexippus]|uniref:uncharacterized protein LOC116772152 n=1 Tax=Danaus plexippus TaxID=13037 RepID=UPI002AAF2393|nr:uncharacterized protein LOC116772152 [Danaus plexippus]